MIVDVEARFSGAAATLPEPQTVRVRSSDAPAVDGLTVSYRAAGPATAPPLVLLHGIASNSTDFRYQFTGFGDELRVIALDAPGYGSSDDFAAETPAVGDYAAAVVALLDALGIEICHLGGSSMGGVIAAVVAGHYPARVRTLVLAAPAPGLGARPREEQEAMTRTRIADMERLGPEGLARERAAFLLAPDAPAEALAAARDVIARTRPHGYAQAARMMAQTDYFADAARITSPTLILRGTEDKLGGGARPLHEIIAGSTFEEWPGLGHLIQIEAPTPFNRRLRDFINAHMRSDR
jgi:pimeloyl-ACP methyl ester carboxylesterase